MAVGMLFRTMRPPGLPRPWRGPLEGLGPKSSKESVATPTPTRAFGARRGAIPVRATVPGPPPRLATRDVVYRFGFEPHVSLVVAAQPHLLAGSAIDALWGAAANLKNLSTTIGRFASVLRRLYSRGPLKRKYTNPPDNPNREHHCDEQSYVT
jgi:hypothetical protein